MRIPALSIIYYLQEHTYIALQALVRVRLWGEAVVLVRTLSTPGLAGHTQNSDGSRTPV